MPEDQDPQDRTEAPTPRRREEARKKGNFLRSKELTQAAVFAAGSAALLTFSSTLLGVLGGLVVHHFHLLEHLDLLDPVRLGRGVIVAVAFVVGPLAAGFAGVALLTMVPGGVAWAPEKLAPDPSRLSPKAGLKNIVGARAWFRLASSLAKMGVLGLLFWSGVRDALGSVLGTTSLDPAQALAAVAPLSETILVRSSAALLLLAGGDLSVAWYFRERDLRMSREDIKDEVKREQGDPEIKARVRRIQRERAHARMMTEVPTATVVVMNPTHFAVALRYDREKTAVPLLVAKGQDLVALRIRRVAEAHGVPIVEEPPLARALYRACEVGEMVPEALFVAVARIVAHVMRLDRRR